MSDHEPLPPATYVNFMRIWQRGPEMFLAFGQTGPEASADAHLLASLVTSPTHAKAMLATLSEAVERYEAQHGPIPETARPAAVPPPAPSRPPRRAAG